MTIEQLIPIFAAAVLTAGAVALLAWALKLHRHEKWADHAMAGTGALGIGLGAFAGTLVVNLTIRGRDFQLIPESGSDWAPHTALIGGVVALLVAILNCEVPNRLVRMVVGWVLRAVLLALVAWVSLREIATAPTSPWDNGKLLRWIALATIDGLVLMACIELFCRHFQPFLSGVLLGAWATSFLVLYYLAGATAQNFFILSTGLAIGTITLATLFPWGKKLLTLASIPAVALLLNYNLVSMTMGSVSTISMALIGLVPLLAVILLIPALRPRIPAIAKGAVIAMIFAGAVVGARFHQKVHLETLAAKRAAEREAREKERAERLGSSGWAELYSQAARSKDDVDPAEDATEDGEERLSP